MYNGQQVEQGQPLIKLDVPTHPGAAAELITRGYVTAPASGRLTRSHVQVGSYLGRGATVAVIQDRSRLHALFRLPTSQAKQLVLGQRLPVTVLDASDQTSLAEVYQLTQATPTQAVLVLQLNNSAANPALRSGVRLRLRLAEQPALAGSQTVAGQ
jgi:multidrug resistance efflux pump